MSVKWMDDPSYAIANALQTARYQAGVPVSSGTGRFGGYAWQPSSTARCITNTLGTFTTGTLAISFKLTAIPAANSGLLAFYDSSTVQCDVRVTTAGALIVTRNGTQIGSTSTNFLSANVWYRLEFQATINGSTGSIEVRVNGVDWIGPTSGLNTQNTANASFNQVSFAGITATVFNDFVFTDSSSPNAGFLGDKRCYLLQPTGNSSVQYTPVWASFLNSHSYALFDQFKDSNGNIQQCTSAGTSQASGTPTWATTGGATTTSGGAIFKVVGSGSNPGAQNWMAVGEQSADGDDTYNSSSTPGQIDLFTLPTLPAGAQNIAAVDNILYVRKDDAGTARTIEGLIKSGGTTQTGPNLSLSTSYQYLDQIQQTDPNTGSGWTVSGVNAMLVGYEEVA